MSTEQANGLVFANRMCKHSRHIKAVFPELVACPILVRAVEKWGWSQWTLPGNTFSCGAGMGSRVSKVCLEWSPAG